MTPVNPNDSQALNSRHAPVGTKASFLDVFSTLSRKVIAPKIFNLENVLFRVKSKSDVLPK